MIWFKKRYISYTQYEREQKVVSECLEQSAKLCEKLTDEIVKLKQDNINIFGRLSALEAPYGSFE